MAWHFLDRRPVAQQLLRHGNPPGAHSNVQSYAETPTKEMPGAQVARSILPLLRSIAPPDGRNTGSTATLLQVLSYGLKTLPQIYLKRS
jgi:hypothetical protein